MVYLSIRTALLLFLAATSLAAPITTPTEGPTAAVTAGAETTPANEYEFPNSTAPPAENEEAELAITTTTETAEDSTTMEGSAAGLYQTETTEVVPTATLTTESPYAPYDCSRTSDAERAHDMGSYTVGHRLVKDLHDIHLRVSEQVHVCME